MRKLCKDCKHFKAIFSGGTDGCAHPDIVEPVHGSPIPAQYARDEETGMCNPDGDLWEKKK